MELRPDFIQDKIGEFFNLMVATVSWSGPGSLRFFGGLIRRLRTARILGRPPELQGSPT
jgi:hypothetical protein